MTKHIFCLTYCRDIKFLYGSTLIFKTLRVGFPNSQITIVDNASPCLPARSIIAQHAKAADAAFLPLARSIKHNEFVTFQLLANPHLANATVILLDPDVSFWDSCEDWTFDSLLAGRLIPEFYDEFTGTLSKPRLHTSFLWAESTKNLRSTVETIRKDKFDWQPFFPICLPMDNLWHRYDTGAAFYAHLPQKCHSFGPKELNSYDHLFTGCHIDVFAARTSPDHPLIDLHTQVKANPLALKGAWRAQDTYFAARKDRFIQAH